MTYFTIAKLLIKGFNRFMKWLGDKQLLKAGEAEAIAKQLEEAQNEIYRGLIARRDADKLRESDDPFADD